MGSFAPGILIAAPPLADPHFDRSVVLLASHDDEGSFGWVINGPILMSMGELLGQLDLAPQGQNARDLLKQPVTRGGPVSTEQVWLIYPEAHRMAEVEGQIIVAPGICATASKSFLERISQGEKVPGLRALAGYAGWGVGQLEHELSSGAWLPADVEPSLIFRDSSASTWQDAYALSGTNPMAFTSRTVGSA